MRLRRIAAQGVRSGSASRFPKSPSPNRRRYSRPPMPRRATKRGAERTPLRQDCDVLICGASFAGLAVARELAGSGAEVLVIDRYEIGERQTSACGIPTGVAARARARPSRCSRRSANWWSTPPTPPMRYDLPWTFSTFDYRTLCALLAAQGDVRVRDREGRRARPATSFTPTAATSAPPLIVDGLGWRRVLGVGDNVQPPDAQLSRGPRGPPVRLGRGHGGVDRPFDTCPPATAGASRPTTELRIGVGSFDPRFHVQRADRAAGRPTCDADDRPLPGQLDPARACVTRPRTACSSSATRPDTACR